MVKTASTMLPLGTIAPDFILQDMVTNQKIHLRNHIVGSKGFVIMFICNHCPYVKHINQALVALTSDYQNSGMAFMAINSNDPIMYPDDSPENMKLVADTEGYHFPYLFDSTQEVAHAMHAACTPDFFVFNAKSELVYRGQFDDSRPGNLIPPTGSDLRYAIDCLLHHRVNEKEQKPSLGCNIKWKP
jgi:thiol-disulfide isomerase/thioredoxin